MLTADLWAAVGPLAERPSTTVVVTAADGDTARAADALPGRAHAAPHPVRATDRALARVPAVGEGVGGDGGALREQCPERDVSPSIPAKRDRDPDRWSRSAGGYEERDRAGRLFGRAEAFRRVATRCDEVTATYLGSLHLVLGFIRLRRRTNVHTP